MRRTDREVLEFENIVKILDKCEILHLGLCCDDKPYVVPMNFAYEIRNRQLLIYLHSAVAGKKLGMIAKNNNVCFEAFCSYKILKAEEACQWTAEFESVIGEGHISSLKSEAEKIGALNVFIKRYGFAGIPSFSPSRLSAVEVLQISVTSLTGKSNIK